MGNDGILNQLKHIVSQRKAKTSQTEASVQVTDPREWLRRQQKREQEKQLRKAHEALEEHEACNESQEEDKIVDNEDLEVVSYDTEKVILVGDQVSYVKPNTPVKVLGVKSIKWDDSALLELLRVYLTKAENLMLRDSGNTGRAKARGQLKPIHATESIVVVDGEEVKLDLLQLDNMAKKIAYQGLSGQDKGEGLISILDKWLELHEEDGLDIRDNIDEIIEFAKQFSNIK